MQKLQRLVVQSFKQPLILGQKMNINQFQGVQIQTFNYNIQQQWFSGFKNKLEQRKQKQGEDEFKKELDFMANKPTFTLIDYKQRIIDGLTKLKKGLRAKFMTGNEETEANLVMQKKIVNALYDEELLDANLIKGEQKKEIAQITQYEVSDINVMLKNYKHLVSLHKWVRAAKEKGEEMPKTQEELMYRFRREQRVSKSFLKFELKRSANRKRATEQRRNWTNKRAAQ